MRKTARTVVWEGAGAQSPAPDPIGLPAKFTVNLRMHCPQGGAVTDEQRGRWPGTAPEGWGLMTA